MDAKQIQNRCPYQEEGRNCLQNCMFRSILVPGRLTQFRGPGPLHTKKMLDTMELIVYWDRGEVTEAEKKLINSHGPYHRSFVTSAKAFCTVPEEGFRTDCLKQNGREQEAKMEICNYSLDYL
ncbi:uncharacterized protein LOC144219212 isoform X2 [Crocuta crocuta]